MAGQAVRLCSQMSREERRDGLAQTLHLYEPLRQCRALLAPTGEDPGGEHARLGLGNIQSVLGTDAYARVRFGIGNEYTRGAQINFVLGEWTDEEKKKIDERLKVTTEIIPSFCLQGIDRTMNQFNNK